MTYQFFFSYARDTYRAAKFDGGNWLDQFFDDLSNQVANVTGEKVDAVGYRDIDRLRLAESWGQELIKGMQDSAVLVCIVSPHYLQSLACGREVGLFRERIARLEGQLGGDKHRIIPVFWIGELYCHQHMHPHVKEFLKALQLTQKGLPEGYPRVGILDYYGLGQKASCYGIAKTLAQRIKELSEMPSLPNLANGLDFNGLRSFFERRESTGDEPVAVGPLGTNVVYAAATKDVVGDVPTVTTYGEKAEDWRPFADKPNRTIGLLTRAALTDAGQHEKEYRVISVSEDLLVKIKKARELNSPVLMVLDQASLRYETIKRPLADYDSYDAPHIGLVTAGGTAANEPPMLEAVFPTKYLANRPHHLWTVPPKSDAYERSVAKVVQDLRANLQKFSQSKEALRPSTMPSLTQPGA